MKAVVAAFVLLAGCATPRPPPAPPAFNAAAAENLLSIGRSTKADVRAALGEATVVDFTSGYEVWVYRQPAREKPPMPEAELVLLFEPAGILSKTRVR